LSAVSESQATTRSVMTADPPTLYPASTLVDATALLAETGERYIVVIDAAKRVTGILGQPDLEAFLSGARPALHGPVSARLRSGHVLDVMADAPFVAGEQTPLYELAMEMSAHDLQIIPVRPP
jgi:CBS domain-containing protein